MYIVGSACFVDIRCGVKEFPETTFGISKEPLDAFIAYSFSGRHLRGFSSARCLLHREAKPSNENPESN